LTAVQRTEETSLCMVLRIEEHAAISCCSADMHANFAPALIAQYEYQDGMARSAAFVPVD
jgi:hypothetical protein